MRREPEVSRMRTGQDLALMLAAAVGADLMNEMEEVCMSGWVSLV